MHQAFKFKNIMSRDIKCSIVSLAQSGLAQCLITLHNVSVFIAVLGGHIKYTYASHRKRLWILHNTSFMNVFYHAIYRLKR